MADYTDKLYKDAVSSQQTQAAMPGAGPNSVTYVDNGERKTGTVDPDYWARMEGYYDQQYNDQVAANNKALEDARARAQEANQAQIDALRQQYQGTNRQLYRDYMQNVKTLPQQMSALGYSGGLRESGRLRLENSYGEALADNERARLGQEAGYNQTLAQQLYEAQAAADSANRQAQQQRISYMQALQEARRQDLMNRAATMANAGDFSLYKELGYSDGEIAALRRLWEAQNPQLAKSMYGSFGGGGGNNTQSDSALAKEISEAKKAGATDREIFQALIDRTSPAGISPKNYTPYMDVATAAAVVKKNKQEREDKFYENMERYYSSIGLPGYSGW